VEEENIRGTEEVAAKGARAAVTVAF